MLACSCPELVYRHPRILNWHEQDSSVHDYSPSFGTGLKIYCQVHSHLEVGDTALACAAQLPPGWLSHRRQLRNLSTSVSSPLHPTECTLETHAAVMKKRPRRTAYPDNPLSVQRLDVAYFLSRRRREDRSTYTAIGHGARPCDRFCSESLSFFAWLWDGARDCSRVGPMPHIGGCKPGETGATGTPLCMF